jgi:hypothetical protein
MKYIIIPLILFLCISCINSNVPTGLREDMKCYSGENTGLDSIINTDGFYREMRVSDQRGVYKVVDGKSIEIGFDTTYHNFLFFNDGIYIGNIWQSLIENIDSSGFDYRAYYHGIYELSGDTIKLQYISPGHSNLWFGTEEWYRIQDKNTISLVYQKPIGLRKYAQKKDHNQPRYYDDAFPAKFIPLDSMPKSTSWLKGEDWFYCDE